MRQQKLDAFKRESLKGKTVKYRELAPGHREAQKLMSEKNRVYFERYGKVVKTGVRASVDATDGPVTSVGVQLQDWDGSRKNVPLCNVLAWVHYGKERPLSELEDA